MMNPNNLFNNFIGQVKGSEFKFQNTVTLNHMRAFIRTQNLRL